MAHRMTRRKFVLTATAAYVGPQIVPTSIRGATAPSNRVRVGFIGTGNQCMGVLLEQFLRRTDVQAVAVCDVNQGSLGYKNERDFYGREPARQRLHRLPGSRSAAGPAQYPDPRAVVRNKRSHDAVGLSADHPALTGNQVIPELRQPAANLPDSQLHILPVIQQRVHVLA